MPVSGNTKPLLQIRKVARPIMLKAISKDRRIVGKIRSEDLRTLIQLGFIKSVKTIHGLTYIITHAGHRLLEEYNEMQI